MPTGKRYERRGSCSRCGMCCINEKCDHLRFRGGKAVCMIHPEIVGEDNREPKCEPFPQAPPILNERCGFYFIDTWEDDRVVGCRQV